MGEASSSSRSWGGPQPDMPSAPASYDGLFGRYEDVDTGVQPTVGPAAAGRPGWSAAAEEPAHTPEDVGPVTNTPYAWTPGSTRAVSRNPGNEPLPTATPRTTSTGRIVIGGVGGLLAVAVVTGVAMVVANEPQTPAVQAADRPRDARAGLVNPAPAPLPSKPAVPDRGQAGAGLDPKLFFAAGTSIRIGGTAYRLASSESAAVCQTELTGCQSSARWLFLDPKGQLQVTVGVLRMKDQAAAARARRTISDGKGAAALLAPLPPPADSGATQPARSADARTKAVTKNEYVVFSTAVFADGHPIRTSGAKDRAVPTVTEGLRDRVVAKLPKGDSNAKTSRKNKTPVNRKKPETGRPDPA